MRFLTKGFGLYQQNEKTNWKKNNTEHIQTINLTRQEKSEMKKNKK